MYRLGKDVHVFLEKWVLTIIDQELMYIHVLCPFQTSVLSYMEYGLKGIQLCLVKGK